MNKILIILAAFLVLLASCQPPEEVSSLPVEQARKEAIERNPCFDVVCSDNEECINGSCACVDSFKSCNDECIPDSNCCNDTSCGEGNTCRDGDCTKSPTLCRLNEVWSFDKEKCVCAQDTRFCSEQQKCIPKDKCCFHNECLRVERCSLYVIASQVCVKNGGEHCKKLVEDRRDSVNVLGTVYDIFMGKVYEDSTIDINFNNELKFNLTEGQNVSVGENLELSIKDLLVFGGVCKEEND